MFGMPQTPGTEPEISLPEPPAPGIALVENLDKKLLVMLRDGRRIIGYLRRVSIFFVRMWLSPCSAFFRCPCRSFDQFANLVLDSCIERVVVGEQFGDIELGVQASPLLSKYAQVMSMSEMRVILCSLFEGRTSCCWAR